MSERWIQDHRRDSWKRQAKEEGYRARSAWKLKQIHEKHGLIREGDNVLDVGCHPGGWAQVAVELSGSKGIVIGVDLMPCITVEGAKLIVGDITEKETQKKILEELEEQPLNVIVSDISPHITGNWSTDQAVSLDLVLDVLDFSLPLLCAGGSFVTKIFQGVGVDELLDVLKPHFSKVRRFSPEASRNSSSEVYVVCRNHKPWLSSSISLKDKWEEAVNRLDGDNSDEEESGSHIGFRVVRKSEEV